MGPGQLGTWNKVPAPSQMTEGMQDSGVKGGGFAGSSALSSTEQPQRAEETGGMKSAQTNTKIGNGNVKKSKLISPRGEPMPKGLMDGGKY